MLEYALVLPAGSGKSTLSSKYEYLIDIDSLHTLQFREELKIKYNETLKTGDWDSYNNFECEWILPKLQSFPSNYVLLVHCHEKANILKLKILGCFKPSYDIIKDVIKERGEERGKLTLLNWTTIRDALVMDSHQKIEKAVLEIANNL